MENVLFSLTSFLESLCFLSKSLTLAIINPSSKHKGTRAECCTFHRFVTPTSLTRLLSPTSHTAPQQMHTCPTQRNTLQAPGLSTHPVIASQIISTNPYIESQEFGTPVIHEWAPLPLWGIYLEEMQCVCATPCTVWSRCTQIGWAFFSWYFPASAHYYYSNPSVSHTAPPLTWDHSWEHLPWHTTTTSQSHVKNPSVRHRKCGGKDPQVSQKRKS